jgi:multicomponent Na+:H+ antiporter subunit E
VNLLVIHTLLAVGWAAMLGKFSLGTLLAGFAIGYAALWVLRPLYGPTDYFWRFWRVLGLGVFFVWELLISSLRVVWDVLTPTIYSRPGVLAVPLDAATPAEITVLANLISLTPGTLSLELAEDRRTLYVHAMFVEDPEQLRRDIKRGLERRVLEVFR